MEHRQKRWSITPAPAVGTTSPTAPTTTTPTHPPCLPTKMPTSSPHQHQQHHHQLAAPTTMCTVAFRRMMSSRSEVPPVETITSTPMCLPSSLQTCDVWSASSRVGTKMRAAARHRAGGVGGQRMAPRRSLGAARRGGWQQAPLCGSCVRLILGPDLGRPARARQRQLHRAPPPVPNTHPGSHSCSCPPSPALGR